MSNRRDAIEVVNGEAETTRTAYDGEGRVIAEIDGNGDDTRYRNDSEGNLTTVIDAEQNRTMYTYDGLNRQQKKRSRRWWEHLGDIYYSGQEDEVRQRFLEIWPQSAGKVSRTLNGNHDMYSGGYGYFDVALPAFSQPSSYFAYRNKNWLLLMLDTAYVDNDLDDDQVAWIDEVISGAGQRRVVLFSHHPLFSNFKSPGTRLAAKLSDHLSEKSITAWYWGHEHHAVIYQPDPNFGLLGRCLGNGGMPAKRKDLKDFPVEKQIGDFVWRRSDTLETPPALYLDGPNPYITEAPSKYAPHGYMTLEFAGEALTERVFSPEGQELFKNVIAG